MRQAYAKNTPIKWFKEQIISIAYDVYHDSEVSIVGFHLRIHGLYPFFYTFTFPIEKNTEVIPLHYLVKAFKKVEQVINEKLKEKNQLSLEGFQVIITRDYCGRSFEIELKCIKNT